MEVFVSSKDCILTNLSKTMASVGRATLKILTKNRATLQPKSKQTFVRWTIHCNLIPTLLTLKPTKCFKNFFHRNFKKKFDQPTFGTFAFATIAQTNTQGKIKRAKFPQHTKVYHANNK